MSTYIIPSIIGLLILLVSYAFLSHSLEKRRVQRQRLLAALKSRERNFRYMMTGLPPQFLSHDLSTLVYRALIDCCEQLAKLEPKDPSHQADATLLSAQLSSLKPFSSEQRVRLENPAQIKDVRQHLQELHRFVVQQQMRQLINPVQAAAYTDQIKRLALQISVDSYVFQAKQAQQAGKPRLAIHFFTMARKLLVSENATHGYDKQIAQLHTAIKKLENALGSQTTVENTPHPEEGSELAPTHANTETDKEWQQFAENPWKKKQVYD